MNGLAFKYQGYFNDSITGQLTTLLDCALMECQQDYGTRCRLWALLVEQVQNIQRYSQDSRKGCVEIGQSDEGGFYVETRNPVTPEEREWITQKLSGLEGASRENLRVKFRDAMKKPFRAEDRGAGLGFLFLAKESRRPLTYRFIGGQELIFQLTTYT